MVGVWILLVLIAFSFFAGVVPAPVVLIDILDVTFSVVALVVTAVLITH